MAVKPIRRKMNGTYRKGTSGNEEGRPVQPSIGRKTDLAINKLHNKIFKAGPQAIDTVLQLMNDAVETKDKNTALKAAFWIGNEYIKLALHNQKLMLESGKKNEEALDSNSDDNDIVTFEIDVA